MNNLFNRHFYNLLILTSFLCLTLIGCGSKSEKPPSPMPVEATELSFRGVKYPLDVKELVLDGDIISLEELEQLQLCTDLEILHISTPVSEDSVQALDISIIGQHNALRKLTLGGMKLTGMEEIDKLFPGLEELHLWYCDDVSLPAIETLRTLFITKCGGFQWEALKYLEALDTISIGDVDTLPAFSLISDHQTLKNVLLFLHADYFFAYNPNEYDWESPITVDNCPDWLPYAPADIQTFVSKEGTKFEVRDDRSSTRPRFPTVPHNHATQQP